MADHAQTNEAMIEHQIAARGLKDPRLLEAMRSVPRDQFFEEYESDAAFDDNAHPIGHGQTISQPYVVALMTTSLDVRPEHRVLEVGTGSGYQAAILAKLAREVCTVERIKPLLDAAWERLGRLEIRNVRFRLGDGTLGWPASEHEPAPVFDRIMITAAAPSLPQNLLMSQLSRDGGIAVLPMGKANDQALVRVRRDADQLLTQPIANVRFVKLVGAEGFAEG